jgi:hypothetical protein
MADVSIQTAPQVHPHWRCWSGFLSTIPRLNDLRGHMDARFADMRETWRSDLRGVEEVLDARLKHLEAR